MAEEKNLVVRTDMLGTDLLERVLAKLGFDALPVPTLDGLSQIYGAWCRRVPFDNVRKLIYLRAGTPGPLPGDDAADFLAAWLAHGTGGTCWAGNGGLHALLVSLGFSAIRGIGTMVTSPHMPPNHGTVVVDLEEERYLVDASILHGAPLRLVKGEPTAISHPAWGVQCRTHDGRWHIRWRPLHTPSGIDCRIEHLDATRETFAESHESTREWSPFNYELAVRALAGDAVVGVNFGQRVTIDNSGAMQQEPLGENERRELLIGKLGYSEEILSQLPPDTPTPPSPWSRAASDFWEEKHAI